MQVKVAIEAAMTITSYAICSGERCIMKRRDTLLAALAIVAHMANIGNDREPVLFCPLHSKCSVSLFGNYKMVC